MLHDRPAAESLPSLHVLDLVKKEKPPAFRGAGFEFGQALVEQGKIRRFKAGKTVILEVEVDQAVGMTSSFP